MATTERVQKPKWTPGPWMASGVRQSLDGRDKFLSVQAAPGGVAYIPYSDRTPADHIQSHADQRLIAAAPELFDALAALIKTLHARPDINALIGFQERAEIEAACDALNKAMGFSPDARAVLAKATGA